jgi:transcription antitermination protein NusB
MGIRRRAREAALKALYSIEYEEKDTPELGTGSTSEPSAPTGSVGDRQENLDILWTHVLELNDETSGFAAGLVEGVLENLDELNDLISKTSKRWKLERMAVIDRNILRMASFEITKRDDIPVKVSINEAIEIAKRFGSSESAAFVNGILDRIAEVSGKLRSSPEP